MFILANIIGIGLEANDLKRSILSDTYLERALESAYNNAASEIFMYDPPVCKSIEDIVLGADEPDKLIAEANGWNDEIIASFKHALTQVIHDKTAEHAEIQMDTLSTYQLMLNTHMIDNNFHPNASYGVLKEDGEFWHILRQDNIDDINAHPENWLMCEIVTSS